MNDDSSNAASDSCAPGAAGPDATALAGGSVCVVSVACPGATGPNEDAALILPLGPGSAVLAVADGVGGSCAGQQASALALRCLRAEVERAGGDGGLLRTAILNGIEAGNEAILRAGSGGATTLAVAQIQDGWIRPYHVGDSMILAIGQKGKIKLQTISHSPVGLAVESGHLDESEAMHHEQRHVVSNVVGDQTMRIEVGAKLMLAPRDTVLLSTDGLFDNLFVEEICHIARKGLIAPAAGALAAMAHQRMSQPHEGAPSKPDDLTIIIFRPLPASSS